MIETTDLMLGNFVFVSTQTDTSTKMTVEINLITTGGISFEGYMKETDNPNYPYEKRIVKKDNLYPITLTPELLSRIGLSRFPNNEEIKYFFPGKNMTYYLVQNDDGGFYIAIASSKKSMRITQKGITYLHELQNSYFSVYKEHLNIKL